MIPAYSFVPPGITGYETRTTEYAEMSQIDREDAAKKFLPNWAMALKSR